MGAAVPLCIAQLVGKESLLTVTTGQYGDLKATDDERLEACGMLLVSQYLKMIPKYTYQCHSMSFIDVARNC